MKSHSLNHKTLLAGALVATFAGFALPSYADFYVTIDPPVRRVEHMEPRSGFVIVPGNWEWRRGRHHWVAGHYVAERQGYRYRNDRWVQHSNNKWTMQRGGWSHDRDGDGVSDRADNHPNDPRRQ